MPFISSVALPSHVPVSLMVIFYFLISLFLFLLPTASPQAINHVPFPPHFLLILCLDKRRWNVVSSCAWCTSSVFLRHPSLMLYTLIQCQHKANRNSEQKISSDSGESEQTRERESRLCIVSVPYGKDDEVNLY